MSAIDLITGLSQTMFVLIFALVALRTLRRATPAHVDMTIFFGILAFVVIESRIASLLGVIVPEWFTDTLIATIVALPYVMLRLVDDFTSVPLLLVRASEVALAAFAIALYATPGATLPPPLILAIIAYFALLFFYSAAMFVLAARRAQGVTRRRMQAISLGAIFFGLDVVAAGTAGFFPEPSRTLLAGSGQVLGLASGVSFYLGFVPPTFLDRKSVV